jgi:DNA-directed RNA polymerase subunit H (RpoH/RPB5)
MRSVDIPPLSAEDNAHLSGFEDVWMRALGVGIQATVREMFLDRGYVLCDTLPCLSLLRETEAQPQGDLLYVYALNKQREPVIAKIMPHLRAGIADTNAFSVALSAMHVRHGVLVAADFSSHHRWVEKLYKNVSLSYFTSSELVNNPIKHELVCPHKALTEAETAEFKRKFMVDGVFDPKCIPALLPGDAMTRYYNFTEGTIVRVYRSLLSCNEEPQLDAFRIVRN